jgi:type II secretory ATPase GspE/PulE/Tfp pilus assembly ATPase PilB-like protein
LHTNDAAGAVTRLLDMGVEAFLISSSLEAVLAQRLVRRICEECRTTAPAAPGLLERLERAVSGSVLRQFFHGAGCEECRGTGYRGRVGIFELLPIRAELRELILQRRSSREVKLAAQHHMMTMQEDALRKAAEGLTSLEEVLRVTAGDTSE